MDDDAAYKAERDEWNWRIDHVMASYGDEEIGHSLEDELLWSFVRAVRDEALTDPGAVAHALMDRLGSQKRVRWYA